MVASVDHLASSAGVAMLQQGGSAADAAVAASAVVAVTCPHLCGMGGDLFALVHDGTAPPAALNASGRAGSGADAERLRPTGYTTMPFTGDIRSASRARLRRRMAGAARAVRAAAARRGARPGHRATRRAGSRPRRCWPRPCCCCATSPAPTTSPADGRLRSGDRGAPPGRRTRPGGNRRPRTRRLLPRARSARDCSSSATASTRAADLAQPLADWVEPLHVRVWDHDVWTIPPNSQGYLTLLGAADRRRARAARRRPRTARWAHLLVEAARAAAHDRPSVLHEGADVSTLLDDAEVARRRALIDPSHRTTAARARRRRRHDVPVRGRPRPHGRVADPVERVGVRVARCSSRRPASACTTAASASRSSPAIPRSTGRAAGRRTRWRPRW